VEFLKPKYIAWPQRCISCYNLKHVQLEAVLLDYLNLALYAIAHHPIPYSKFMWKNVIAGITEEFLVLNNGFFILGSC